jgi:hypothetical protein
VGQQGSLNWHRGSYCLGPRYDTITLRNQKEVFDKEVRVIQEQLEKEIPAIDAFARRNAVALRLQGRDF